MYTQSLPRIGELIIHRSSRTTVDTGNNPSAWTDAPTAFFDMLLYDAFRIFVSLNSGSLTSHTIQIITKLVGGDVQVHEEMVITSDFTSPHRFLSFAGYKEVYVKIIALSGSSPNITIKLQAFNN